MATLSFKTEFPWGEPNYFIPKIWRGLREKNGLYHEYLEYAAKALDTQNENILDAFIPVKDFDEIISKIHTIREDPHDLWKPGRKIHFVVFNRTPNRFQFAPVLECKKADKDSFQLIYQSGIPILNVENKPDFQEIEQLTKNDGFNLTEDFFQYFSKDFTGKIIHWTDWKY